MLKNALPAKNTFTALSNNNRLALPCFHKSFLSTNSAIRKGLRKATHSRSRLDPPARVGGITRKRTNVKNDRISGFRDRGSKLPSRHFPDDDAPMARSAWNVPLKRQKSLAESHDVHRSTHGMQRDATRSMESVGNRGRRTETKITRAERRAALFGHKDNPPEGYKGLPSKASAPPRSSQNRQGEGSSFPSSGGRAKTESKTFDEQRKYREDRDYLPTERLRTRGRIESRTSGASTNPRDNQNGADTQVRRDGLDGWKNQSSDSVEDRPRRKNNAPLAIPYTTPASEFLYGHSVVTMALKSSRRSFYKLYLYDGDATEFRGQDKQVRKLALAANIEVTRVGNDWIKLMDKMSGGRPHNGYILEASPLPKLPVTGLKRVPRPPGTPQPTFDVILDHQSREEEAVNGTSTAVPYGTGHQRYPFLLLLDGIKDPGNIGAIIRSSHFLGADGILICTRNSAALTPVALKAAAGAAEMLPLFSVSQPASFIDECQENGWKFYAAVSPSSSDSGRVTGRPYYSSTTLGNPTQKHPCILVLGSEGDGLRWNIQKKADFMLGVEAQRTGSGELDSLNVSVASALLCDAFLRQSFLTGNSRMKVQEEQPDTLEENQLRQDIDLTKAGWGEGDDLVADDRRLF